MAAGRIVVLGGGPAGAATAVGLARLGENVLLVGEPRRFAAVEGASTRVVDAIRGLGFASALEAFAPPSPRRATWNGVRTEANTESLVDRQRFDRALLDDVERQGVAVLRGRIIDAAETPEGYEIRVDDGTAQRTLDADFLVEARGRPAPAAGLTRVRGAGTVSLLQYWQGAPGPARSAVESCEDGWVWMASLADGRRYLQLTLDVDAAALPPKKALAAYCASRFRAVEAGAPFVQGAEPVGEPHARASTPILNEIVGGPRWIRVGDAAMAVDPLSGNGIFQALSSALQAPAVVATLRHDPERSGLAIRFHQQRIEHLFYRFARIGRDFYAQETRWSEHPFWRARRGWPDAEPLHAEVTPGSARVARGLVVRHGRIAEEDVVVTPDQPLGVWHLDGIPLAPLLSTVQSNPARAVDDVLREVGGLDAGTAARIARWMLNQGWVR